MSVTIWTDLSPIANMIFFIFGMLVYKHRQLFSYKFIQILSFSAFTAFLLFPLFPPGKDFIQISSLFFHSYQFGLILLAFPFLVYNKAAVTNLFLDNKIMSFIGRISYSAFFVHYAVILAFLANNLKISYVPAFIVIFSLTTVISYITFRFIEKPGIKIGNILINRFAKLKSKNMVTVLMPVYNGEKYLKEAIESILNQTYKEFEFLIINDGSTDNSAEIINSFDDPRINFIQNAENIGLADTLNKGLEIAKGEYIVRMDQDDIALADRLEKQIKFMDKNPHISICGGSRILLGHRDGEIIDYPTHPEILKAKLLFGCFLAHPTVIMRKNDFEKHSLNYKKGLKTAEDYELWARASKYLKISNLKEPLIYYRGHEGQLSGKEDILRTENFNIRKLQLENLEITPSDEHLKMHEKLSLYQYEASEEFMQKTANWLSLLVRQNEKTNYYSKKHFYELLFAHLFDICMINRGFGLKTWDLFINSDVFKCYKGSVLKKMNLYFMCFRKELKKRKNERKSFNNNSLMSGKNF